MFHPVLVSLLFLGPSLLVSNLYRKFFTPSKWSVWTYQKTTLPPFSVVHREVLQCDLCASSNVKKIKGVAVLPNLLHPLPKPIHPCYVENPVTVLSIPPTLAIHVTSLMIAVLMQRSLRKCLMPDSMPTFLNGLVCTALLAPQACCLHSS